MKCYTHNNADAVGTCTSCGKALCTQCALLVNGKIMCKDCAVGKAGQSGSPVAADRKEPVFALLLSLVGGLVTGSLLFSLGQLYNGKVKKFMLMTLANLLMGVIYAIAIVVYVVVGVFTLGIGCIVLLPLLFLPLIIYGYEIYDAYVTAERMNRGEHVPDWFD